MYFNAMEEELAHSLQAYSEVKKLVEMIEGLRIIAPGSFLFLQLEFLSECD